MYINILHGFPEIGRTRVPRALRASCRASAGRLRAPGSRPSPLPPGPWQGTYRAGGTKTLGRKNNKKIQKATTKAANARQNGARRSPAGRRPGRPPVAGAPKSPLPGVDLHSAKGGAVETGCSDLHDVTY